MYVLYLATRSGGPPGRRLLRASLAAVVVAAVAGVAYGLAWGDLGRVMHHFAGFGAREPTNSLYEPIYIVARLLGGDRDATIAVLANAGTLGLLLSVIAGSLLAVRARDVAALAGSASIVLMLLFTLGSPVFHPWYLMPCLVLAVELRDATWLRWMRFATTLPIGVDCTGLLPLGSASRISYTVVTSATACVVWLTALRARIVHSASRFLAAGPSDLPPA
jgi:hypothetical protein